MQPAQLIMTALSDRHRFGSLASAGAKHYSVVVVFIPSGDTSRHVNRHSLEDQRYFMLSCPRK